MLDRSIATATAIYNLGSAGWDEELLAYLGISPEQLSTVVPTTHVERTLLAGPAAEFGLSVDTPVVQGASDGVLSSWAPGP